MVFRIIYSLVSHGFGDLRILEIADSVTQQSSSIWGLFVLTDFFFFEVECFSFTILNNSAITQLKTTSGSNSLSNYCTTLPLLTVSLQMGLLLLLLLYYYKKLSHYYILVKF